MKTKNTANESPRNALLADLAAAFAAGLTGALMTLLVRFLDQQPVPVATYVKYAVLGVASYSAVALVLHRFWTGTLRRVAPAWLLTAFFGSILFVLIRLTPAVIKGWHDPLNLQPSLLDYAATEISAARSVVVFLSFVTIPVSGVVYFVTYFVMNYRAKGISVS